MEQIQAQYTQSGKYGIVKGTLINVLHTQYARIVRFVVSGTDKNGEDIIDYFPVHTSVIMPQLGSKVVLLHKEHAMIWVPVTESNYLVKEIEEYNG